MADGAAVGVGVGDICLNAFGVPEHFRSYSDIVFFICFNKVRTKEMKRKNKEKIFFEL